MLLLGRVVLSRGRRLVRVRRLRFDELRMLLRLSDGGAERSAVVCFSESAPVRDAGSNARDPAAVRPLLSRPHERANFCALAAPDDGAAFAVALACAGTATELEPVHRADPGALPRSVSRARVRTHGDSNAGAQ